MWRTVAKIFEAKNEHAREQDKLFQTVEHAMAMLDERGNEEAAGVRKRSEERRKRIVNGHASRIHR